jgi:hypothetical protein
MAVTVDHQPLRVGDLGLRTVGQLFSHLQRLNRLVVHVLIDGREPDLGRMGIVRRESLDQHELFIETADPRELARDALNTVADQLKEADRLRIDASDLLRNGSQFKAMEKLSGCFSTWQHAQESILKTAQLLRIDLGTLLVNDMSLTDLLGDFTQQLRDMKAALEHRDFVLLGDILTYEAHETSQQWRRAVHAMLQRIDGVSTPDRLQSPA